ncbi:NAD-dependent deacetylase [Entamoeba marina]
MDDFLSEISDEELESAIKNLARTIARANKIVVLTGAGISVASGIPDFRSHDGLWKRYDPKVYANYTNFIEHPEMFWKMCTELPHFALAELHKLGKLQTLITQNVDNLHQLSGIDNVIELHGTGKICHCISCDYRGAVDHVLPKGLIPWIDIPRCPKCGSLVKLDVVLFGEPLQNDNFEKAFAATSNSEVFLVVGSSLEVMPANALPRKAKMNYSTVAYINKSSTRFDNYTDYCLRGEADIIIPKLVDYVNEYMQQSCIIKCFDTLSYSLRFLHSPIESITQIVALVVAWSSPKTTDEDICNCLVDSSDVVIPATTNPTSSIKKTTSNENQDTNDSNNDDKIIQEIIQSVEMKGTGATLRKRDIEYNEPS